jgi:long-chain acyl-CoA synthetase
VSGARAQLASLVDDFERHGAGIAIVARRGLRERRTTYAQLATLARRFAATLTDRGIEKGDRVLLWGENGAEWVAAFFGCVLRGALPVPIDFASDSAFARRVGQEVSAKLVTGDAAKLEALHFGASELRFERFESELSPRSAAAIDNLRPDDLLQIVFTSGTTGEPKGVVHTHGNVLASLEPIEREMHKYLKYERWFHPIRILHTLPLSHVFGQFMGLWIPPLLGAELHYESRLVAPELIARIHRERISVVAAVPRVLDLFEEYLLTRFPGLSLRFERAEKSKVWARWWLFRDIHRLLGFKFWAFVCGGASLSAAGEGFWSRLGFVVVQGYGMTETTALVSLNHPFRPARGTIGQVLPGREVRLAGDGEVLVRGATISTATWQHGQLERQDSEWLGTGDLAEFDERGNLRFRGRKKDVIVTAAGLNIYPEDLEAALSRQPGVKANAVIETIGEHGPEPLAALVLAPGSDPQVILEQANRELADFQKISRWMLWPEPDFPRTSTGKILKREVARQAASQPSPSPSEETPPLGSLDSLGRVQLQAQLEQKYGISLDDQEMQQIKTAADISRIVTQAHTPAAAPPEHIYPVWPWNPMVQAFRALFLECIAFPLARFLAKPKLNIQVKDWPAGPLLIVANHITSYDGPLILLALPGRIRRRVAIAMSAEMLLDFRRGRNQGNWFLNLLAPAAYVLMTGLFNVFPLPQASGFRRSFEHAGQAVDRGYSVLVFPEGHRSEDGTPQPFKGGAGLLWKELGIPALPAHLSGLGEIKAHQSRWFRTGTISVSVGEPLTAHPAETPVGLTESLRRAVFDRLV